MTVVALVFGGCGSDRSVVRWEDATESVRADGRSVDDDEPGFGGGAEQREIAAKQADDERARVAAKHDEDERLAAQAAAKTKRAADERLVNEAAAKTDRKSVV